MDYKFDFKTKISSQNIDGSLYKWYLTDLDGNEDKESFLKQYIPWGHRIKFTIDQLRYYSQHNSERDVEVYSGFSDFEKLTNKKYQENFKDIPFTTYNNETISAKLDTNARLSFFGTNRLIETISLQIQKHEEELVHFFGSIQYTDLEGYNWDDHLLITLRVKEQKFEEIKNHIINKLDMNVFFSITGIEGFYSDWDPEGIDTYPDIKILTYHHKIEDPENLKIEPIILGLAQSVNFDISSTVHMKKETQDNEDLEHDDNEEEDNDQLSNEDSPPNSDEVFKHEIMGELFRMKLSIERIYKPLWIIVILLVIFLFNHLL